MTQTAIVAGVGPTIGDATARELHEAGYDVGLFARSTEFIDTLAADLGDGAMAVPTDVTDADGVSPNQIEWGAVAPAAQGLATSIASELDGVQVTYTARRDLVKTPSHR